MCSLGCEKIDNLLSFNRSIVALRLLEAEMRPGRSCVSLRAYSLAALGRAQYLSHASMNPNVQRDVNLRY